MATLTRLFEPLAIGSLTLRNRIVMPPITTLYDTEGGPRHDAFFAERARGGAAMIVVNLQALYPGRGGRSGWVPDDTVLARGPLTVNHDEYVPRLQALTGAIHAHGCKAAVQLAVYGFWAKGGYGAPAEELSPSGVCLEVDGQPPPREVLQRLSTGGVQVFPGAAGCLGPRPLLVQVNAVVVSGNGASAHAGVQQGRSGALTLHKVQGEWQVLRPPGPANDGPQLSLP